ncbi:PREDICTED: uncharacterized protein LOC104997562 [Bison bison bison]|uniref:Uncharacterized protein LOC104997562 n=1 Tax=Bison bison bison TaxID=43346 RepID=A0A6P3I8B3_BISBB|nr:PREDICTED: uncharacterized protein LOC104997562 [Bison bison bison]
MNSESKVRRCAKGAEKGALAWGVRNPLGTGERDNTLPPLGIPFLWGHAQSPERSRYPRQAVATSNTGDFFTPQAMVVPSGTDQRGESRGKNQDREGGWGGEGDAAAACGNNRLFQGSGAGPPRSPRFAPSLGLLGRQRGGALRASVYLDLSAEVCMNACASVCKNTPPFKGLWSVCRCDNGGRPKCALLEPGGARIKVCLKCPRGRSCSQDLRPWYPECWLQCFGIFTRYLGEPPRIDVIPLAAGALRVSE